MPVYAVTLYFSPEDHREPEAVDAPAAIRAAAAVWQRAVDAAEEPRAACARVTQPDNDGAEWKFALEPVVRPHVTSVGLGRPVPKPTSLAESKIGTGLRVRPALDRCLAHLRPQPRRTVYMWPESSLYSPDATCLGPMSDEWAVVVDWEDVVRDFTKEDPSYWNLGAQTYRHALVEYPDGRQGWVATDRLEVQPPETCSV